MGRNCEVVFNFVLYARQVMVPQSLLQSCHLHGDHNPVVPPF
jgi:hypothetical protein